MSFRELMSGERERLQVREEEQERELKRQRTAAAQQQAGIPYLDALYLKLLDIQKFLRAQMDDETIRTVEVEVRLGMIVLDDFRRWKSRAAKKVVAPAGAASPNLKFKAGIDQVFAKKLKKKLADKRLFSAEQKPLQILRSDGQNNRWEVVKRSDGGEEVRKSEKKVSVARFDLALLAHDYDIRINAATEKEGVEIAMQADLKSEGKYSNVALSADSWTMERRKKRVTYRPTKGEFSAWHLDLTDVEVVMRDTAQPSFDTEIELELDNRISTQWLCERNEVKLTAITQDITLQLSRILDYCIPFLTESEEEESLHPLPVGDDIIASLRTCNGLVGPDALGKSSVGQNLKVFDFLGSMPVNLTRRNFLEVQSHDYYLTEKSDGVRFLLYVIPDESNAGGDSSKRLMAVMVNRSKVVYSFRGSHELGQALGAGTVLDGELVYNRSHRQNVFLVFDILLWKSRSLIGLTFAARMDVLVREVMPQYTAAIKPYIETITRRYKENPDPVRPLSRLLPIELIQKVFVTRKDLASRLLGKMSLHDGEHVFFDGDKRHHKSDGIILQPNAPYTFSKNYDLMKWKWAELRSVDLQVEEQNDEIHLKCGGPDGTLIDCTKRGDTNVGLGIFDVLRLRADMRDPLYVMNRGSAAKAGNNGVIAEVAYDVQVGLWSYVMLRKDKSSPNFIDSVMGVFMEQAESISVEELEYSLNAAVHALENDYDFQVDKMKSKLLKWQRDEVAKRNR